LSACEPDFMAKSSRAAISGAGKRLWPTICAAGTCAMFQGIQPRLVTPKISRVLAMEVGTALISSLGYAPIRSENNKFDKNSALKA
jgi:hypothetical protein